MNRASFEVNGGRNDPASTGRGLVRLAGQVETCYHQPPGQQNSRCTKDNVSRDLACLNNETRAQPVHNWQTAETGHKPVNWSGPNGMGGGEQANDGNHQNDPQGQRWKPPFESAKSDHEEANSKRQRSGNRNQVAVNAHDEARVAGNKLALCLYETGSQQQALEQLSGSDCFDKDAIGLHYKTAMLYCDKIKFASSLINLEHQLETSFTSSNATHNISIVLQNLGLLDRATANWDNLADTADQAING